MFQTVELPFWALILILAFAAVTFASHFLFPSVRWFFRRRMERAVAQLNTHLARPIEPFRIMRRQDQVTRLIYDPKVMEAVRDYAQEMGVPPNVAFERARSYAREIVPGFSTATYFGFAIKLAQRLSQGMYKVRLGGGEAKALEQIDRKAAVVFVMNHRSNMDYVLITWLASSHSALSYAVGEWARVWPLKALIRAMGAYFIRRRYSNSLYRAILARYVQMSIQQGTTQAIFPEGGLSLDGSVGKAKKGLLHYIVRGFNIHDSADVVFVPVALNYDRVLEDRVLITAGMQGIRRFPIRVKVVMGFILRILWQKARGRFSPFGYAAVCYGAPLSLREFLTQTPDPDTRALSETLMLRIRAAVPVLPVPLVAAALVRAELSCTRPTLQDACQSILHDLAQKNAWIHLPEGAVSDAVEEGLSVLIRRRIITQNGDNLALTPGENDVLSYYAASVLQRLTAPDGIAPEDVLRLDLPEKRKRHKS
ncbi:1-acyl-sn-glycerol-3-phosphate acyltransferase [Roseinatronobacter alkalisoli]|uniref:Glycerol-3-phosphate acyltransferase n=1 Tax=Roseinatronobacter alkalisoli TaxID=3028235 RepID=A0ABT5T6P2_9RHOB|nr:1-acyl-sn-glycerol-3-phosphate acyltransferase [Roseinatronobacter sp. HJB301]MDD7970370.1 1-acyl-sn-glycerol-3-phosphate acyltransferase [Roseinatronobacter sp. HJB301]